MKRNNKYTKREMFAALVPFVKSSNFTADGISNETFVEMLENEIALLDNRAANRKPKRQTEADVAMEEALFEVIAADPMRVFKTAEAANLASVPSTQKAATLLRKLVEKGRIKTFQHKGSTMYQAISDEEN